MYYIHIHISQFIHLIRSIKVDLGQGLVFISYPKTMLGVWSAFYLFITVPICQSLCAECKWASERASELFRSLSNDENQLLNRVQQVHRVHSVSYEFYTEWNSVCIDTELHFPGTIEVYK